jgi:hypothetical protein
LEAISHPNADGAANESMGSISLDLSTADTSFEIMNPVPTGKGGQPYMKDERGLAFLSFDSGDSDDISNMSSTL